MTDVFPCPGEFRAYDLDVATSCPNHFINLSDCALQSPILECSLGEFSLYLVVSLANLFVFISDEPRRSMARGAGGSSWR